MKPVGSWGIAVLVAGLMVASLTGSAAAAGSAACLIGGGGLLSTAAECVISSLVTSPCPYSLTLGAGESLHFTSTGKIDCGDPSTPPGNGAQSITINVPFGNLVMEAGSAILAENDVDGGSGANITITVGGNMTMCGPAGTAAGCSGASANPGAKISTGKLPSTGEGDAGNINITVGNFPNTPPVGNFIMEPGTEVLANSVNRNAGDINITVGNETSIDGHVLSESGKSGTGSGTPGGGPIFVKSGCKLTVTPDGKIRSMGQDPGPDLVHLEGCDVFVYGLVASVGVGHESVTNLCNGDTTAHPLGGATQFTACVEIWGNNIVIDASGANKGEVSADGIRKPNRAWIDLFAQKDVTIIGDTVGNYAVHANAETTSDTFGGLITIKAKTGKITTSNLAIQANATGGGGDGGVVILQAAGNVDFGSTSSIQATAPTAGSNLKGGSISARSFASQVLGSAGSSLDASGDGVTFPGVITLQGCGTGAPGDGVNYTGASTPLATIPADDCSLAMPTLPAAVVTAFGIDDDIWAACGGSARKSGMKFNDASMPGTHEVGESGLDGWTIHVFGTDNFGNPVHAHATTAGGGLYAFGLAPGTYTVCEQVTPSPNPGFVQSFPVVGTQIPAAACTNHAAAHVGVTMGTQGYTFTLKAGDDEKNNDFGNRFESTDTKCPEDPTAVLTRTIDTKVHGALPNHTTWQAAYNAAANNEVIGAFINTTENVVLNGAKTLKITQCTLARVTAANNGAPVFDITSTGKLTIVSPETLGGTIGWRVAGNGGHSLKSIRATGAGQYGVLVLSSGNGISWNSLNSNGVGMRVEVGSNSNDLRGGTIASNAGDGVQIAGNLNSFQGATIESNAGNGVYVSGAGNTIRSNKANKNALAGFKTAATATGTKFGSNASNTSSPGGSNENGGAEYSLGVGATNLGSNKADTIGIPKTSVPTKCPTFPAAGSCE